MYLIGKVIQVFEIQTGESARGSWKKREFIVETFSKVPKKVCLVIKGESVETLKVNVGENLKISVDIESKEFKERWYTEVRAWKVEPAPIQSDEPMPIDDSPF